MGTRKPEADVSTEKLPPPSWMTSAKQPPQDQGQEICQGTFLRGLCYVSVDVGAAKRLVCVPVFNQKHHFQVPPVKSAWGARSSQRMTMGKGKKRWETENRESTLSSRPVNAPCIGKYAVWILSFYRAQ
jgi:hypothetical protein